MPLAGGGVATVQSRAGDGGSEMKTLSGRLRTRQGRKMLQPLIGSRSQLAGVTAVTHSGGSCHQVRALEVRTGGGLRFSIRPERGMEIADVEYDGIPFGFDTGVGPVHPDQVPPGEDRWLSLYSGGLLTTAGLDQIGEPCELDGVRYGLHGEIALQSAEDLGYEVDWQEGTIRVWGTLRQVLPTKRHLELVRTLTMPIGGTDIRLHDRVTNLSDRTEVHLILYHLNLGYPLLDRGSRFVAPIVSTQGWDERSEAHREVSSLVPGLTGEEYLFGHQVAERGGWVTAGLLNPRLVPGGTFCAISYRVRTLPRLWQWVSLRPGTFVMGIEPANGEILGRAASEASRSLSRLEAGASVDHLVQVSFGRGEESCAKLMAATGRILARRRASRADGR